MQIDDYGIGPYSDSDDDAEAGHNSMPNLGGTMSAKSSAGVMDGFAGAAGHGGNAGAADGGGGQECLGSDGLHLFFIWLDPSDPCADRRSEWPMPEKYQTHVRRWEERYRVAAQVYGGQQCLDMVQRVNFDEDANCFGLLDVYLELARDGNWIKMVDIARVAIMYLEGGMYLDTDMDLGPRTFSAAELLDSQTCFLVHDADGALQNHFFRAPRRHAFIKHVLHVLRVNALAEVHVVQATGPCALTAALRSFRCSSINIALPPPPERAPGKGADVNHHGGGGAGESQGAGGAAASDGRDDGVDEGPEEEDIFSRGQMEALVSRIRQRLVEGGYPLEDPLDAPLGAALAPSREAYMHSTYMYSGVGVGHRQVFIYPPAAFYLVHWRESRDLATGRSCCNCYAIHNWDTTWAPASLLAACRPYTAYLGYLGKPALAYAGYAGYAVPPLGEGRHGPREKTGDQGDEASVQDKLHHHSECRASGVSCLPPGPTLDSANVHAQALSYCPLSAPPCPPALDAGIQPDKHVCTQATVRGGRLRQGARPRQAHRGQVRR